MKIHARILLLLTNGFTLLFLLWINVFAGKPGYLNPASAPLDDIDSLLNKMSLDEKIGQLFMIPVYSSKGKNEQNKIANLINQYHIGALIFMQGNPAAQKNMITYFQSISKTYLLIAQDAEWGPAMRLDSTIVFPHQLTLGAIQDPQLIYDFGKEVARECRLLGVNMNFAPVIDINNNPRNPIINDRSFGENRYSVALRGLMYMKGLQENGVIACGKHFPGHGDTDKDSHKTLPGVNGNRARLDSIELFPYKVLIPQGLMSIMSAHLFVPALDNTKNMAASLSPKIIQGILRDDLGFDGLIVTDALSMKGVSNYHQPGELELKALLAGNDILLFPEDIPKAIVQIKQALSNGTLSLDQLDNHVIRILKAKVFAKKNQQNLPQEKNLNRLLNNQYVQVLNRQLYAHALTLVKDRHHWIPLKNLSKYKLAALSIGAGSDNLFLEKISKYASCDIYHIDKNAGQAQFDRLLKQLSHYDRVIVGLHDMSRYYSKQYGINQSERFFLKKLNYQNRLILTVFGNPYSLKYFPDFKHLLLAYEDNDYTRDLAAQALFGAVIIQGNMPVSASETYPFGTGLIRDTLIRLGYNYPVSMGMADDMALQIDQIAHEAIQTGATPGCQIFIARNGQIIYDKAFGYFTYDKRIKVQTDDLYDLASLTKVAATTLSLMYLFEQHLFNPNLPIGYYLKSLGKTAVSTALIKDIMTHTAGLKAWIPFYLKTIADSLFDEYYCHYREEPYTIQVANQLYIRKDYPDTMYKIIRETPLKRKGHYKYSDLGFYLLKQVVEQLTKQPIEDFVQKQFYQALGLHYMTYRPLEKFGLNQIVPTEYDSVFRKQLIQGYVHDPGAAMIGGVSGHAGLFSNAENLGILMQMLLNGGAYGGDTFLKASTINYFTRRQNNKSRRGLGFDKPEPNHNYIGPTSELVSLKTFGHTGFTGTCAWVDPQYDLVYVFLSNRVHPTAKNKKLITENIRTRIQDVIYESMDKGTFEERYSLGMADSTTGNKNQ